MTKEECKERVTAAIQAHKEEIFALAEAVFREPELGFKETKTAAKIAALFQKHNIPATQGLALTGVKGRLKGRSSGRTIAVLGELDAVICHEHPAASSETGAAHACGHHAQLAAMAACAIGLAESGVMQELDGDVVPFAVPAEEYVEIEYRNRLRTEGKLGFLAGKAELIRIGAFDDIDMSMMMHLSTTGEGGRLIQVGGTSNGFIGKLIRYKGREAHAAGAPHEGVNALNAAMLAMMAVHAQRETFRDEDHVRFHPIITKGGDLVNVVPSDVRLESYVRARTVPAIIDANVKIDRALQAGALAIGADVEITDLPGYLPLSNDAALSALLRENAAALVGADKVEELDHHAASTDMGDLSHIMPVTHPWIGGVTGNAHTRDFCVSDPDMAYLISAQTMAHTIIDLLYDHAAQTEAILAAYTPPMTRESYVKFWEDIAAKK